MRTELPGVVSKFHHHGHCTLNKPPESSLHLIYSISHCTMSHQEAIVDGFEQNLVMVVGDTVLQTL